MSTTPEARALPVSHLTVLGGLIDQIGMHAIVGRLLPEPPSARVSDADGVVAMMLNILRGRVALAGMVRWLARTDVELRLGEDGKRTPSTTTGSRPRRITSTGPQPVFRQSMEGDVTIGVDCKLVDPQTRRQNSAAGFHPVSLLPNAHDLRAKRVKAEWDANPDVRTRPVLGSHAGRLSAAPPTLHRGESVEPSKPCASSSCIPSGTGHLRNAGFLSGHRHRGGGGSTRQARPAGPPGQGRRNPDHDGVGSACRGRAQRGRGHPRAPRAELQELE